MALAGCLELAGASSSAQAQFFGFGGRRWGVAVGAPGYYDGYYGYHGGYYEPGYYGWNRPYYPNMGYWGGDRFVFPRYEYGAASVYPYFSNYAVTNNGTMAPTILDPSVTVAAITASDTAAQPSGSVASQSFYSGPPANNDRMEFKVMLPASDARLFFNDQLVDQKGDDRTLTTASALPGSYDYRVRATWQENGQEKSESHDVHLHPGQRATIQFGPAQAKK
jgi:uncharacterized protein (TIGR03000 family)